MPRYTEPAAEQQLLLTKLGLELPQQPPPKIYPNAKAAQELHQEVSNHEVDHDLMVQTFAPG